MQVDAVQFFSVWIDGIPYGRIAKSFEPPKVKVKSEDLQTGSMLGQVAVPTGLEKMDASIAFAGTKVLREKFQLYKTVKISLKCSLLNYQQNISDAGSVPLELRELEIAMRGKITELDLGTIEPSKVPEIKVAMNVFYYRLIRAGIPHLLVDFLAPKYQVFSTDALTAVEHYFL